GLQGATWLRAPPEGLKEHDGAIRSERESPIDAIEGAQAAAVGLGRLKDPTGDIDAEQAEARHGLIDGRARRNGGSIVILAKVLVADGEHSAARRPEGEEHVLVVRLGDARQRRVGAAKAAGKVRIAGSQVDVL